MSLEEQVEKRETRPRAPYMKPTDISDPNYFHKVVDCQWACPAHTPVPEYIRMIAQQRYTEAYMINWESNVFPGVLDVFASFLFPTSVFIRDDFPTFDLPMNANSE